MSDIRGKTGWGGEFDTAQIRADTERRGLDTLTETRPHMMRARPSRAVDETNLSKIHKLQEADGIEGGISLRYVEQLTYGRFFNWLAQRIGSCVASGSTRLMTRRMLAEISLLNSLESTLGRGITGANNVAPFAPYRYGAGRHIGGLRGYSDGSFCAAQIEADQTWGILPCDANGLQTDAYPEPQDERTYRSWGADDRLITRYRMMAKNLKLIETEKITEPDRGKAALVDDFKGSMICSMWAFRASHKHATWKINGEPVWIYKRDTSDEWAHNMTIDGFVDVGGEWYVIVDNSWGPNAHKGRSWFPIPFSQYGEWLRHRWTVSMTMGDIEFGRVEPEV